jgi:hypothetical protein
MIYRQPSFEESLDQGDIIDGCPVLHVSGFDPVNVDPLEVGYILNRVLVLTQTCDLANEKTTVVVVARIIPAQKLVDEHTLKSSEVRGPIRSGRVYGLYYLPKSADLGLPEAIVDLRQLHTVRLDLLQTLCGKGLRRARIQPLYWEHLAKHFADTYSRIGLPEPYDTEP